MVKAIQLVALIGLATALITIFLFLIAGIPAFLILIGWYSPLLLDFIGAEGTIMLFLIFATIPMIKWIRKLR